MFPTTSFSFTSFMTLLCWINIWDDDYFARDPEETFFSLSQIVLRRWTVSVINFQSIRFNNSVLHGDKGLGKLKLKKKLGRVKCWLIILAGDVLMSVCSHCMSDNNSKESGKRPGSDWQENSGLRFWMRGSLLHRSPFGSWVRENHLCDHVKLY